MPVPVISWTDLSPLTPSHFGLAADEQQHDELLGSLQRMAQCGASPDLLSDLWREMARHLGSVDLPIVVTDNLSQFIDVSRSPTSLLALFQRDQQALPSLLQVLSTSPRIASLLVRDPESFDFVRASDGQPATREVLIDELANELSGIRSNRRAAVAIRRFAGREILRIAYGEFVRDLSPDRVGQQITRVTDAVLTTVLDWVIRRVACELPPPTRLDNSTPRYAIIALGNYGGEEIGYDAPLDVLLLCDQIDRKNQSHVRFNRQIITDLIKLCTGSDVGVDTLQLRFVSQPGEEANPLDTVRLSELGGQIQPTRSIDFHTPEEATAKYERDNRTWQRLAFVKARWAAGDQSLATGFINRIQPWVYHRLLSRGEIADIRVLRRKIEKRALTSQADRRVPISDRPGGRRDIELTVQFLQLQNGAEFEDVRVAGTLNAINQLAKHECLTPQQAQTLSENHARLCRLEHHLAVLFEHPVSHLPEDPDLRARLAWRLGVRREDPQTGQSIGDLPRFESMLQATYEVNRKIINDLMAQETTERHAIESELILDPDPDLETYRRLLQDYGFSNADRAIDHLTALSHETVTFLSPRRCRHFFAAVAPRLLKELSSSPDPDRALERLVEVTDSIGAKATLWELLHSNQPTLKWIVRLCAETPYLSQILIDNPGMIDELIDSLVMDRLPSRERIDAQSIQLCRGAEDIDPILRSLKASTHLIIGLRDLLGKEDQLAIAAALSDTADSCLRRVIQWEQEQLAVRYGDPVDEDGKVVDLVAVALNRYGSCELNYQSDLDVMFVYAAEGETQRRVGGPRSTLSNKQFFNRLVQNVRTRLNQPQTGDQLFELDLPLATGENETVLAMSLSAFAKPFRMQAVPLWIRIALARYRPLSGSKESQQAAINAIAKALKKMPWRASDADELLELRRRNESTAAPDNFKRGSGGLQDVQFLVAAGVLKHGLDVESLLRPAATTQKLVEIAKVDSDLSEQSIKDLCQNYLMLLKIESKLRLVQTLSRHELPVTTGGGLDSLPMRQLSALMRKPAEEIVAELDQIRAENRKVFLDAVNVAPT